MTEDLSLIVILIKRKQNLHCGFQRDFTEPSHLILTREPYGLEEDLEADREDRGCICRLGPPGSRLRGGTWGLGHFLGRGLQEGNSRKLQERGKREGKWAEAEAKLSADSMTHSAGAGELWR